MATITPVHADNLGQIFQALRSQTPETRLQAAIDLRRYVGLPRLPVLGSEHLSGRHDGSGDAQRCGGQALG